MSAVATHTNIPGDCGARLRRCATCKQSKPLADYRHRSHRHCGACMSLILEGQERRHITAAGRRPANAPITNATTTELYDGAELRSPVRPGALDAFAWPSRYGSRLVYRDGREF